jgi:hypothetical protein
VWDNGLGTPQTFTITYDPGLNAIGNVAMRDSQGDAVPDGSSTDTPIVGWDPVPGAASYEVQVSPFTSGACDWSQRPWDVDTASTYWTPLGSGHTIGVDPWPNTQNVTLATDLNGLSGSYCVRVRAKRAKDTANSAVAGSWTQIGDGTSASFTFAGYSSGQACSSCAAGYLGSDDYLLPQTGTVTPRLPLFTWNPISGYNSYYVVVATDDQFQHVVDYAWTRVPAYAPRAGFSGFTNYADSTLYWAVLPATSSTGTGVSARPDLAPSESFSKQSSSPTLIAPADNASVSTWPVFQWSPVEGAYDYHLEVATDSNFSNLVTGGDVTVDETSYTPSSTYPAGRALYWRVQAEAAHGSQPMIGLAWSSTGHFTKTLGVPTFTSITNATSSDGIPVWTWNPVDGAVSYDLHLICSAGSSCTDGTNLDTTATALVDQRGVDPFQWQVRANFPTVNNGTPGAVIHGAYTAAQDFQRTIQAPQNLATSVAGGRDFSLSWDAKAGAKTYTVEVSTSLATNVDGSFTTPLETISTEVPNAAPTLGYQAYLNGGTLYWHVAAKDADSNLGAFTAPQVLALPVRIVLSGSPTIVQKNVTTLVTITAKDSKGHALVGVLIKDSGAGVTAASKTTGSGGKVTFKVHPTKAGTITFTGTKASLQTGKVTVTAT